MLIKVNIRVDSRLIGGLPVSLILVEVFQNGMVGGAPLRAIVGMDSLLLVLAGNVVDFAGLCSVFGEVSSG